MNIKITVKRDCKYNGLTYETITIKNSDIEQLAISKCKDMFNSNESCTFKTQEIEVNTKL